MLERLSQLKLWLLGPCSSGFPCNRPGTKLCYPHPNSRPVFLCPVHEEELASVRKGMPE